MGTTKKDDYVLFSCTGKLTGTDTKTPNNTAKQRLQDAGNTMIIPLGPLHMSPVTELARSPGRILLSVPMGNFSPVDRDEVQETTKMVERKLVSFAAVAVLWTLVTLLIKLIRLLLKWKYIQG